MSEPVDPNSAPAPAAPPPEPDKGQQYRAVWKARRAPAPGEGQTPPEPKQAPPPQLGIEHAFGSGPSLRDLDAQIEQELQEAMGALSEGEMYGPAGQQPDKAAAVAEEGIVKGTVMSLHGGDVFIDIPGSRNQGLLPVTQFPEGKPAIGTEVEVRVDGYDEANGLLILARQGAAVHVDWSSVARGMTVEARVTATNKGGLSVEVNGIRGFMPISQIDLYRVENAESFVNQKLLCVVTEVKPDEKNLVVSRRALLEKEREEAREKLWQELEEGQIREGVVRNVRNFGAFVDIGGADGLIHVSEMSWSRVADASQVLHPGERVKVVVLKIDRETRKIGLGLKQLTTSPWDTAEQNYPPNSIVKGKVTRLADYGEFVELEPGIEGMIHISELAPHRIRRVNEVVKPDQEVQVMIVDVDRAQRRIALSLKQALPKEGEDANMEEDDGADVEPIPERVRTTPLRGGISRE